MAKLPTQDALGDLPKIPVPGGLPSIDMSAIGKGYQNLGEGIEKLGLGLTAYNKEVDDLAIHNAKSDALTAIEKNYYAGLDDADYRNAPFKMQDASYQALDDAFSKIPDGPKKLQAMLDVRRSIERRYNMLGLNSQKLNRQEIEVDNDTKLTNRVGDAAADPAQRAAVRQEIRDTTAAESKTIRRYPKATQRILQQRLDAAEKSWNDIDISNDAEGALYRLDGYKEKFIEAPEQKSDLVIPREDRVNPEFSSRLRTMYNDAPPEVQEAVSLTDTFRTHGEQADLYRRKPGLAARPGHSRHERGDAADMGFKTPEARKWFHDNAAKYGLRFPMSYEPWHIQLDERSSGKLSDAGTAPAPVQTAQADTGTASDASGAANAGASETTSMSAAGKNRYSIMVGEDGTTMSTTEWLRARKQAEMAIKQKRLEAEADARAEARQKKEVSEEAMSRMTSMFIKGAGDPTATVPTLKEIGDLAEQRIITDEQARVAQTAYEKWAKGTTDTPAVVSRDTLADVMRRMDTNYTGEDRIKSSSQILDLTTQHLLTPSDAGKAVKILEAQRDSNGLKLSTKVDEFAKAIQPMFGGKMSMEANLNALQYKEQVWDKINQYQNENKDPHLLFRRTTPDGKPNPDYVGDANFVRSVLPDGQQKLFDQTRRLEELKRKSEQIGPPPPTNADKFKGAVTNFFSGDKQAPASPVIPSAPAQAPQAPASGAPVLPSPGIQPRLPGESFADWLARKRGTK